MNRFKVVIIGGGPGGYVSAIRLQQYGIEVAVFEKERLGGVCLNHGCIPTKSLVKVAELYSEIKESENFGILVENVNINYKEIWQRKNKVVEKLVSGVEFMFQKRKIQVFKEVVTKIEKINSGYKIIVNNEEYFADYVILATGSKPKELPFIQFNNSNILSSKEILKMEELPKKLVVIGGGVIGCEFASIYNQLGVDVEIVEFLPSLINQEDSEISKRLGMSLKRSGIKLHLKTAVEDYQEISKGIILKLSSGKEIEAEKVLVSIGREPVMNITFENCELNIEKGFVNIDNFMRTNLENVFAIGDVTGKLMLAHTASKQGLIVADIIQNELNEKDIDVIELDYKKIPACTFTNPEIASVGYSQKEAEERFGEIIVGKFPYSANGKALGMGATFGFVKVIASEISKKILGVHIIGQQATELIAQAGVLIGLEATVDDVKKVIFAHPTLSEIVMEAVEDLEKLAIHKI
ncbi:MAG: dihydrolipoyl dehydrogenase [Candidatus Tenebribacter davisii]|nr:dihydrolipoyl dehydrogenase [Candidatus Tenebribacter davisii]